MARKTGEDPIVVSLRRIGQIKQIVYENVDHQMKKCRPCEQGINA